jgi:hypothetical protein
MTSRTRGAQPGNNNALKHGFYSREFRNVELHDLDVIECSLENEIAGLRVAGRRIFELTKDIDDPMKAVSILNIFGANCQRVARLLQVHATLSGGSNDVMSAISQALDDAWKEMKK